MKQVLIIGYVWPEPQSSAAGSRMIELIHLFLEQEWEVTFASPAADSEYMCDIEVLGARKVSIELNRSSFDDFARELQPDLVVFDRFMMEEQFGWRVEQACPGALRVLDTIDLHCLRDARHQALKEGREWTKHDLFSEMAQREIASVLRCDLSLITSSFEMELLTNTFNVNPTLLHHLPFMLDPIEPPTNGSLGPSFSERKHFISIGNFRHEPNWDAVLYLKQTIWPMIRRELPEAKLHIYGAYPPPKATQLHNPKQGFLVRGRADDARCVMQDARICLAPLRFGAGIKGKLNDAMRYGTPSITTDIGAEAMHEDHPWNGVIENDPAALAQAAIQLYHDEAAWQTYQRFGITIINACYNKSALGQNLLERLKTLQNSLAEHRLTNFTGAMLRHHTLKSTQYMSLWIEAKNKLSKINPSPSHHQP